MAVGEIFGRTNPFVPGSSIRPLLRVAFAALLVVSLAGSASAQRPSLADLQSQIDALTSAYCDDVNAAAAFCPVSCPCDLGVPYAAGSTCDEVAAGDYEVTGDVTYTASCAGQCAGGSGTLCTDDSACTTGEFCNLLTNTCHWNLAGTVVCTSSADCPGTSDCFTEATEGSCSISGDFCLLTEQCPGGEICDLTTNDSGMCAEDAGATFATCTTDADCAPGSTCSDLGDGTLRCLTGETCGAASCSGGSYTRTFFSITNVGEAGSGQIATCDMTQVDADEALYCIGLVEAELGTSCVPF